MQRWAIPDELLADAKKHVNITWDDQSTDDKIRGLIAAGSAYLDRKCGAVNDYESDGQPRTLLLEYVRYGMGDALDVFENNYRHDIIAMQNDMEVTRYLESTGATEE